MSDFRNELKAAATVQRVKAEAFAEAGVQPREKECRALADLLTRAADEVMLLDGYRDKAIAKATTPPALNTNQPQQG